MRHNVILTHEYSPEAMKRMRQEFELVICEANQTPLLDEQALAEKLESGELFGAGLDVYKFEPLVTERLKRLSNVVLLPHIGSAVHKTRLAMAMMTFQSILKALAGQVPDHLIPEWRERLLSKNPVS